MLMFRGMCVDLLLFYFPCPVLQFFIIFLKPHTLHELISVSLKDSLPSVSLLFLIHTISTKNRPFDDVLKLLSNINISCHHATALHDLELTCHLRYYTFIPD